MQDFQQQQLAFIRRIKDPTAPLPAGMRPERMAVYEELFFNNLQNFINSAFPVLHSLVVPAQWQLWCRQFFRDQPLHSPYFLDISASFLQWLPQVAAQLPPFAVELAHYEWLELALSAERATAAPAWTFSADRPLWLSPLARLGSYQYPVHRIRADFQPQHTEATFILLFRDPADQVRFILLNAWTAALLQLISAEPGHHFTQYVEWLLPYLPGWSVEKLSTAARPLLAEFAASGIFAADAPAPTANPSQ